MDAPEGRTWFVGDMADAWVAAIASSLPAAVERVHSIGPMPEGLLAGPEAPDRLALHREFLVLRDAESLARYRAAALPGRRVVLCAGPHIRRGELERWVALGAIDEVVPEATAFDTLARRLVDGEGIVPRPIGTRSRVSVVSANYEMRETLADACEAAGFSASRACDWSDAPPRGLALWDVPVLEPGWPRALARRAEAGPVIALLGFPDRALVSEARACGAAACLELPCDLADLVGVLDRVGVARAEPPHAIPPVPALAARRESSRVAAERVDA